jgi:hypothetical protein
VNNLETEFNFPGLESLGQNNVVELELYTWLIHYIGTSVTNAFYGRAFLELSPDFMATFCVFDSVIWKMFYKYPKFMAMDVHEAKYKLLDALEKYYVAWSKSEAIRKGGSDMFNKRIKMMYDGNCSAREITLFTLGIYFAYVCT